MSQRCTCAPCVASQSIYFPLSCFLFSNSTDDRRTFESARIGRAARTPAPLPPPLTAAKQNQVASSEDQLHVRSSLLHQCHHRSPIFHLNEKKKKQMFFFSLNQEIYSRFLQRCQCSPDTSRRCQIFPFNCQHFRCSEREKRGKLTTFGPEVVCAIVVLVEFIICPPSSTKYFCQTNPLLTFVFCFT